MHFHAQLSHSLVRRQLLFVGIARAADIAVVVPVVLTLVVPVFVAVVVIVLVADVPASIVLVAVVLVLVVVVAAVKSGSTPPGAGIVVPLHLPPSRIRKTGARLLPTVADMALVIISVAVLLIARLCHHHVAEVRLILSVQCLDG